MSEPEVPAQPDAEDEYADDLAGEDTESEVDFDPTDWEDLSEGEGADIPDEDDEEGDA